MKTFTNMAAQGDFIIFRVDTYPGEPGEDPAGSRVSYHRPQRDRA
jgi:hypothetical protein